MQTTQSAQYPAMRVGELRGSNFQRRVDGSRLAEVVIAAGHFVCLGTAPASQAKLPTSASEVQTTGLGFAVLDLSAPDHETATEFAVGQPIPVLEEGEIVAYAEEAMAITDTVYVRHTSDGGSNTVLGRVRNDADSNRCASMAGRLRVKRACTAAGPVLLEFAGMSSGAQGPQGAQGAQGAAG